MPSGMSQVHCFCVQAVSGPDASSPAGLISPAGHGVHTFDLTYSFSAHSAPPPPPPPPQPPPKRRGRHGERGAGAGGSSSGGGGVNAGGSGCGAGAGAGVGVCGSSSAGGGGGRSPSPSPGGEGPNCCSAMLQKGHFFGRPSFLSREGFRSLFRQTHRLSKPSTATGVAGQRFFLPPRPPVSAGAFLP